MAEPSSRSVVTMLRRIGLLPRGPVPEADANRFTEAALERHKREGMEMAVRARWAALAVVAIMLMILNPEWYMLYYVFMLGLLALVGLLAQRVARVGVSRMELLVLFLDLLLTTVILTVPNPFSPEIWPSAAIYKFETFPFFFIILAGATLAYSWRTILALGVWTCLLWLLAGVGVWYFGITIPHLSQGIQAVLGHEPELARLADPNLVLFDHIFQQLVVFFVVALTLAFAVRRNNRLLLSNAGLERERENLSRYFSPNVVDVLSRQDEPLKQIRQHDIAVLFVDIVDFTAYASTRDPRDVIDTLRDFHARMEREVFRFSGTLDKYLGDGLMATFGTPVPGVLDATNALRCARAMQVAMKVWNQDRIAQGLPEIQARFGLHYGPVVLADIGTSRLEFTVVGTTVNIASRIEAMTRFLGDAVALSEALRAQVVAESGPSEPALKGLREHTDQTIRGVGEQMTVWSVS